MNFLEQLTQLFKQPYRPKAPTPANKRAAVRLEAHRKIWDDTPSADTMSRQRRRRAAMGRV